MKKILFVISALALLMVSSCKKDEPGAKTNDPAELTVEKTVYSVSNGAGVVAVPVEANYNTLKVAVIGDAQSWLSYKDTKSETKAEMETYFVTLSYQANPYAVERSGVVSITLDDKSVEVTVTQEAAGAAITLDGTSRSVNPKGQTFGVEVTCNDEYTVTSSASWATFNKSKSEVTVTLNDTGEPRSATLTFTASTDATVTATLALTQKAANVDPELINILAIGDGFTQDATANLYPVLAELGYTKIKVASIALDGKTYAEQYAALIGSNPVSVTTADADTTITADQAVSEVLGPDDWDAIVLQPGYDAAAQLDNAGLAAVVAAVRNFCEFTPLYWNMAWAPAGEGQADAYEALAEVAQIVAQNEEIEGIIPVGTLVQNLRSSIFGDRLTLADKHLTNNIGKFAASYLWAAVITGKNVPRTELVVNDEYRYEVDYLPAVQEALNNTIAEPYELTPAVDYAPYKLNMDAATASSILTGKGYNPSDYVALPLTVIHNAFYNSTGGSALSSSISDGSNSEYYDKFAATEIVPKAAIPIGSLIVVLDGYQYRPEAWTSLSAKTTTRPGNVTDSVVEVNDAWWGSFNFRAFNIAKSDGSELSAADMKALDGVLGIFVPKTAVSGGLEDYVNGTWKW